MAWRESGTTWSLPLSFSCCVRFMRDAGNQAVIDRSGKPSGKPCAAETDPETSSNLSK
jgi:hypothetical protein